METVLIVIHLMIVLALIGTVLLQRSEGGALGIGGGGGGGGFMTGRGAGNALTRATAILAAGFFATSIALTLIHRQGVAPGSILEGIGTQTEQPAGDQPLLQREQPAQPQPQTAPSDADGQGSGAAPDGQGTQGTQGGTQGTQGGTQGQAPRQSAPQVPSSQ